MQDIFQQAQSQGFPLISYKMSLENQYLLLQILGDLKDLTSADEIKNILQSHNLNINALKPMTGILQDYVALDLITKDRNGYKPNPEVIEYSSAINNKIEKPFYKLASVFKKTWFFKVLKNKLEEKNYLSVKEAKDILEDVIGMPLKNNERSKLGNSIVFLVEAGLLTEVNNNIRLPSISTYEEIATNIANFIEDKLTFSIKDILYEKGLNAISINLQIDNPKNLTINQIEEIELLIDNLQKKGVLLTNLKKITLM